jgi:hypothetical protein
VHPERIAQAADELFLEYLLEHDDISRNRAEDGQDQILTTDAAVENVIRDNAERHWGGRILLSG